MVDQSSMTNKVRKEWVQPELKKISAGSAETGPGDASPDGGPVGGDVRS